METTKKRKRRNRKPIKYNITEIYNENKDDIKVVLRKVFINYCMEEFEKIK